MQENLKLKIKEVVENNDFHQAVLDIGYKWWNKTINDPNSANRVRYLDMINYMKETYGWEAAFLILIGKYNYQVNNGGHIQYFDNGYTDGITGFADFHDPEMPLHNDLIIYFLKFLKDIEKEDNISKEEYIIYAKVLCILQRFKDLEIDTEEYTEEEVEYEDEDGDFYYEDEEVRNDNYGYILDHEVLNILDDEYCKIESDFMKNLNNWVKLNIERV